MTQDEIIEIACQAFGGLIKKEERDNFVSFAKLVAAKEREECAKVCEEDAFVEQWKGLAEAAKRIRARGQE